jgi:hypothetical protein
MREDLKNAVSQKVDKSLLFCVVAIYLSVWQSYSQMWEVKPHPHTLCTNTSNVRQRNKNFPTIFKKNYWGCEIFWDITQLSDNPFLRFRGNLSVPWSKNTREFNLVDWTVRLFRNIGKEWTILRHVMSHKIPDLMCSEAEAWDHGYRACV